ncbi:MAG TPA: hypothetical protein VHH14_09130, partial [Solirubrobacterales bacterium]|nr:hypothetical protein [Solirubrobacterales bacterium]
MRLLLTGFLLLLTLPATANAAELSFTLETDGGVRYGSPHEAEGFLTENGLPLAGQPIEIQARRYPYDGEFRTVLSLVTDERGAYGFRRRFDRNVQLRAVAPAQALTSAEARAYVFPRPRSVFKALRGDRLRIVQYLRTPAGVRLKARSTFYLGPKRAKSAKAVARAKPKRIGRGRFKATATV